MIKTLLVAAAVLTAAVGCAPTKIETNVRQVPSAASELPSAPAATAPAGEVAATTEAAPPVVLGPLTLEVFSPLDGTVVATPRIDVTGRASAGAVVSVNDEILIAGADGLFQVAVALEEGPNLIEVVASDALGSETAFDLLVTYQP